MLRQAVLIVVIALAMSATGQILSRPIPKSQRRSESDLEVTEGGAGKATTRTYFLSRSFLTSLPHVSAQLRPDENFPELPLAGATITGVDLDVLLKSLAPSDPSAALVAICRDGYTSPFPRSAILDHHPILVLAIDGLTPHRWALKHHAYDPGPYFISYANFVPSFHLLAHEDFPQHPAEIVRLKIVRSEDLFAAITPPDVNQLPPDSPVITGFRIAQQNCFRCHNSGDTGGTKAVRTWQHLSEVAKTRPDFFAAWVHNPQSIDPHAEMTPNLKYDQPTLNALTRYFQTLAP